MSYLVYNTTTTRLMNSNYYKTPAAAKAALTRAVKADNTKIRSEYAVAETIDFYNNIEKTVERTHALTGEKFRERANTPFACSPSSETYWSM